MGVVEVMVADEVARVTLNRPPLNVLDLAAARELGGVLEHVKRMGRLCCVVLRASGKAFCAGVDVRDHLPDRGADMLHEFHRACRLLLDLDVPVIAAVHGAALGGGCELTLCCDLVLAAESATFGFPEIKLGVFPPVAAVGLARIAGAHRASELVLTGRVLTAAEAERVGLVSRVTADGELEAAVDGFTQAFVTLSASGLRAAKRALRLGRPRPGAEEIAAAERLYLDELLHHPDAIEGLQSFLEKRPPRWGRR